MKKINDNVKTIVKAVIKDSAARRRRKAAGEQTVFDRTADAAIEAALSQLAMPKMAAAIRKEVLAKIMDSLEHNMPWETVGDTYMGRRQFYGLRNEFIYLVARNMGMVDAARSGVTKRELKQYIAQLTELDALSDQIGRMEDGPAAERRKALRKIVKDSTERIEGFVSSIGDSETRQIIMLKYMDPRGRLSWQQVANRMTRGGYQYTADYCRIKVDRYLEK